MFLLFNYVIIVVLCYYYYYLVCVVVVCWDIYVYIIIIITIITIIPLVQIGYALKCKSYLSKIHETRRFSTSVGSMFNSCKKKKRNICLYSFCLYFWIHFF